MHVKEMKKAMKWVMAATLTLCGCGMLTGCSGTANSIADSFTNNLIVEDRYRMILDGLRVTLIITLFATIFGTLLGGLVCWMRMHRRSWVRQVAKVYIDIMRGTPVLVLLMLMYYVVMTPVDASGIVVAIVTFAMNMSAYVGEMLRTTIEGIDRGQTEAGLALGFTKRQTFFKIVMPQVVKAVMPVYQGEVISLLKGTSIVGYIAVADMTRASDLIRSRTFDAFFPLIVTAIIYFLVAWLIGLLLQSLVQRRYRKTAVTAVALLLLGTVGYLPAAFSHPATQSVAQADVPAPFKALDGKRVGVVIGSIQDIAVSDMAPSATIMRLASESDILAALENGKVDVIGSESLMITFSRELAAKLDTVGAGLEEIPIGVCFQLDNAELKQDFDSFLAEIHRDGTYRQITDRWTQATDFAQMPLPQQRGTGRTVRVATFPAMPPLNYISNGKPSGLEIDMLTEWANRRNLRLEFLVMDFAAQIPAVQSGKADLAMGAISITEERQKQVLFSDGYFESHIVLATRKGEASILTNPTAGPTDTDKGTPWLWIAAALVIVGGGVCLIVAAKRRKARALRVAAQTPESPDSTLISISHMKKSFGSLDVLRDINTDVHRGDVISIIGPSGTGKSTLLRALNMLEPPTSGEIKVDGEAITAKGYPLERMRRKMGMVFQSFNLFNHLTILQNVTLAPMELLGKSREEAEAEALQLLRKVGMAEKADVYPSSLSGGQKQRVAIARALAMHPEAILFDEPTSALDPTMVGEVLSIIRQLAKEGMTMLIVTHEMKFARDVSTRIFFMYDGYIHEDGSPQQIFGQPVHSATKAFVNRIQKLVFEVDGDDFDFLQMHTDINQFCIKYNIAEKAEPAWTLIQEVLFRHMPAVRPITVRLTHTELSGVTALDFMVERLTESPLTAAVRDSLRPRVSDLIEEPTTRGFRIKLML